MNLKEFILHLCLAALVVSCIELPALVNTDLFAYYSASKVVTSGENPYVTEPLLTFQKELKSGQHEAFRVWNPPTVFGLFIPLSLLGPENAVRIWFGLSLLGLTLSANIWWCMLGQKSSRLLLEVSSVLLFLPALLALRLCQLNAVLLLFFVLGLLFLQKERFYFSGLLLGILFIKPHAFWLPCVVASFLAARALRWQFFLGAISAAAIFSLPALLFRQSVWLDWIHTPRPPVDNIASSLVGIARLTLSRSGELPPLWPGWLIPGLALLLLGIFLLRSNGEASFGKAISIAAILSPIAMPYGFFNDQLIAVLGQCYLLQRIFNKQRSAIDYMMLAALVLLQISTLLFAAFVALDHRTFWYPIGLLCIFAEFERREARLRPCGKHSGSA